MISNTLALWYEIHGGYDSKKKFNYHIVLDISKHKLNLWHSPVIRNSCIQPNLWHTSVAISVKYKLLHNSLHYFKSRLELCARENCQWMTEDEHIVTACICKGNYHRRWDSWANVINFSGENITWLTAGGAIVQLIIVRRAILARLKPRIRVCSRLAQGYSKNKLAH